MERYPMLLGWKKYYHKNGPITQSNLQIQCDLYQITQDIFHRTTTTIQKLIWNHKTPRIAKEILKKKSRKPNSPRLQTILQKYSNQDGVVLVHKQTNGQMDPRNKPRHV